ncbi:glycosyltransferase family 4 protein [Candidatus Woesearchaeota archaeon]|nr:glycosyltransferase family 4 protein [Candidatus Woesearchaeota archaeon]
MRICILCTSYPRSKNDHWVPFMHSLAKELAKTEDVTVVASGDATTKSYEVRDKVKIHRFNYFYPKKLQKLTYTGGMRESFGKGFLAKMQAPFFMLAFLTKSLKIGKNCDVVNAHWTLSGLAALPLKMFYKKPIVLTEHGGSIRGLPRWLNRFVFRRMDIITSAHNDLIEEMKKMGIKNIADARNFLDEEKFLRKHDKNAIRKELGIKEKNIVTFIGRFEDMKDPLNFVESIPHAIKKTKDVKFIIIGDGHLRGDIANKIKSLKIGKNVILPGPNSEIGKYLSVSDIFVACSKIENCFSTTILEAMLSKVPCIITKAGQTEKYFIHNKYAYLVEKQNPKALGEAIAYLLKNTGVRKKLASNGMDFLEKYRFRKNAIRNKMMGAFNKAINR